MLKERVVGKKGHLSNVSAGQLLAEMMSARLKHVFLGHLSHENNRPLVAMDTVSRILAAHKAARGLQLTLAQRDGVSEMVVL
jgi:phosphoribosyl 1,2-cyclic phosphodiesterase